VRLNLCLQRASNLEEEMRMGHEKLFTHLKKSLLCVTSRSVNLARSLNSFLGMVLKCSYPLIQISHFWEITLKEII
jgi:hypothetical protein